MRALSERLDPRHHDDFDTLNVRKKIYNIDGVLFLSLHISVYTTSKTIEKHQSIHPASATQTPCNRTYNPNGRLNAVLHLTPLPPLHHNHESRPQRPWQHRSQRARGRCESHRRSGLFLGRRAHVS